MTMIIQAVETEGRSVRINFSAIEFAGKKSPDLAFSKVDRYDNQSSSVLLNGQAACYIAQGKRDEAQ